MKFAKREDLSDCVDVQAYLSLVRAGCKVPSHIIFWVTQSCREKIGHGVSNI